MHHRSCSSRGLWVLLSITTLAIFFTGCSSKASAAKNLDGVYHPPGGGPMTLAIKDGKATLTIGTESHTMDYKLEGNKLTIHDPQQGDVVFTINDDGTLNSQIGVFQKSQT
jgi:hypothetical protein